MDDIDINEKLRNLKTKLVKLQGERKTVYDRYLDL